MPTYSVEWTFDFDPPVPDQETVVDELLEKLSGYHAIASVGASLTADLLNRLRVRVTVDAGSLRDAACGTTYELVTGALQSLGVPATQLQEREVTGSDVAYQAEDLARPPERYVGVTEVAELLGVSRQRASELRTRRGFPAPIAELASGPVWTASSLGRFLETWERRPGRPRTIAR